MFEQIKMPAEQGSVCDKLHLHLILIAEIQQFTKLWMQQRFALNMQVDIVRINLDLFQNLLEFIRGHKMHVPVIAGTKRTG